MQLLPKPFGSETLCVYLRTALSYTYYQSTNPTDSRLTQTPLPTRLPPPPPTL